jgi:hypothetical protein
MARPPATPRDPNLEEIDRWCAESCAAQLATIRENRDMLPDERMRALVEAERLSAAMSARMKADYHQRQRTAPR